MATGRFERILSEEDSAHLLEELNSGKITVSDLMVTLSLSLPLSLLFSTVLLNGLCLLLLLIGSIVWDQWIDFYFPRKISTKINKS
jgi:hypothetical protein